MNFVKRTGIQFEKSVISLYNNIKVRYRLYNETKIIGARCCDIVVLSKLQKQQIQHFFSKYFKVGKATFTAHQYYLEKTGVFDEKYIPDPIWYAFIDPFFNNWTLDKYLDNKCYYTRMFPNVRMPQLFYYRLNGFWFDESDKIVSREVIKSFLSENKEKLFLKIADSLSGCGYGVTFFNPMEDNISKIIHILERTDDLVIQGEIKQHPILRSINESSVNTIRILSLLRKDGSVKTYSSVLRVGRRGKKVDNASSGGLTCGITADGRLKKYAYNQRGDHFEKHPDNGMIFEGVEVPSFNEALRLVNSIAPIVPHFRLVSWDVAIDEEGFPLLIEMNPAYGELGFHQLNNGPIFKEDTEEILEEVFLHKK